MPYKCYMQTGRSYSNNSYGTGTIGSSGCGPSALSNALRNAGIATVSVPTMCAYSVSVKARIPNAGTDMQILIKNAAKKWNFTYKTTSKNAELIAHLKAGGTAVLHNGGGYPLFSNSGHFVAAIGISGDTIYIADSLYYTGKWTKYYCRRINIKTTKITGVVKTNITAIGKATADRSPSYYLISKNNKANNTSNNTEIKKEDDEVVTKTKIKIDGVEHTVDRIVKDERNYVKLADFGSLVGLKVGYDGVPTVDMPTITVNIDGKPTEISGTVVDGKSYVRLTELLEALGHTVTWTKETGICVK